MKMLAVALFCKSGGTSSHHSNPGMRSLQSTDSAQWNIILLKVNVNSYKVNDPHALTSSGHEAVPALMLGIWENLPGERYF